MRHGNKIMNNKLKNFDIYSFLIKSIKITTCIIISCVCIIFINHVFNKNYSKSPPEINIIIDKPEIQNTKNLEKFQTLLKEELLKELKNRYDETVSLLNFTIEVFAISLTLILAVAGLISFNWIRPILLEVKQTLSETEKLPQNIIQKYNEDQLKDLLNNIFSNFPQIRSESIQRLYTNTAVTEKNYELLIQCLEAELYEKQNIYFYNNIHSLCTLITRLNKERAKNDLFKLIIKNKDLKKTIHLLIPYINLYDEKEDKNIDRILNFKDFNFTNSVISALFNSGNLSENILKNIISKSDPGNIAFLFSNYNQYKELFDERIVVDLICSNINYLSSSIRYIFSNPTVNLLSQISKFKILTHYIQSSIENEEKFSFILTFIKNFTNDNNFIISLFNHFIFERVDFKFIDSFLRFLESKKSNQLPILKENFPEFFL